LPLGKISHVVKTKFSLSSEVLNTLVFLNNLTEASIPSMDKIKFACTLLESLLMDLDEDQEKKLSFILEQLEMLQKSPKQRRYPSFLIASAMMWQMTSPALYNQLLGEGFLTLPSVRHLKRLSSALTVDGTLSQSTLQYLKQRIASLSERERIVTIIFDEVYSAKRVEFTGGKLFGVEEEGVAKTLLCYMVKSVASNYRDMVAMLPISKIDSSVIERNFHAVLRAVFEVGFDVVCVSSDGHSANRMFYQQLCGGKMQPFIPHPLHQEKRIYLIFDPVHLFKNFFTNFLNRTTFSCPSFDGKLVSANFNHVSQLYHMELKKPLKVAHKIVLKVLAPRPIERCNVMLAVRMFHESTIAALRFYSDIHPEWAPTADFLDIINTWWNIVNVRTTSLGMKKRDDMRRPIIASDTSRPDFLRRFCTWLKEWQSKSVCETSLSRETFTCAIQTGTALPDLAAYLLEVKEFRYVLLGKINSDAIEHRFGHYRQLAGANYFLSVRQFLEAEKAIRLKSLVKYSKLSMEEITVNMSEGQNSRSDANRADIEALLTLMEDVTVEAMMSEDRDDAIVYFVAGYIARGLVKKQKCQLCIELICESTAIPPVRFCDDANGTVERSAFLDQINRGGLVKPSDLLFIFCLQAHELQKILFGDEELKNTFIASECPRAVFTGLLIEKLESSFNTQQLLETKCSLGHDFTNVFRRAAQTYCNCMLKNFVSEINDKLHEARKRSAKSEPSADRKISKLQSK
jgi:hypothetical protein